MITVTLYTRRDCPLCDETKDLLEKLRVELSHQLLEIDIESSPALAKEYGLSIPVVVVGPFRLSAPIGEQELRITLAAAQDRERHIQMVENSPKLRELRERGIWTKADDISNWFSKYYIWVFNLAVILYLGLAFLAPVLMKAGLETPANWIYKGYSLVCHQLAFRSFFLFGEQIVYPRADANLSGLLTFEAATGLSESANASDMFAARNFVGNETLGYKIALCQRDVMIYLSILTFGVLFALTRYRIPALPWYLWLVIGIAPIALDGFSQLFSQPPLNFLPLRESTPQIRSLTGFLFGFTTAWFGYPIVEESMRETRQIYAGKWVRTRRPI
ncbi:MAG: DUF2085 domain-containing protein [Anaerolineae bacterium]|jgi:uncharacterized membrane protein/glutaredoxin|nr:DUF2085 domain-containing protein [Anaerolineae bacterium]MCZ7553257.1 DUF2085 domain-containing protein [Anaerolineales bacterium]